jgi:hypothetical protein
MPSPVPAQSGPAVRESLLDVPVIPDGEIVPDGGGVRSRPAADNAVLQLLRSATSLQAEDLLRTIGAMASRQYDLRQWSALVESQVRDLSFLATCAAAAGARLPAGFDGGSGDPTDPGSAVEGLLASHEALLEVLRQLATRTTDPHVRRIVCDVLDRREEEAAALRSLGAGHGLPAMERLVHGRLPKYQA